jgi:hypothetical protein
VHVWTQGTFRIDTSRSSVTIHSDESRGGIEGAVKVELNVESVARAEVKAGDGVRDARKLELYAWRPSKRV